MSVYSDTQVEVLAWRVFQYGGSTAYRNDERYAGRYIVGGIKEVILPRSATRDEIWKALKALNLSEVVGTSETLGGWTDHDGKIHLDLGDTYESLEYATQMAKHRGERAIWDRIRNKNIYVWA